MKRVVIGYIFDQAKLSKDEKDFLSVAHKQNTDLVFVNLEKKISEEILKKLADQCDIFFNNSAEEFAIEIVKSLESLGKKVVDSSHDYYYIEDKWLFYLKCHEGGVPTPRTILLSEHVNTALSQLNDFGSWPIVLKRIEGTCGEYVELAKNISDAKKIISLFWKKGSEKLPIIAQEFISSPSYRVTMFGDKIMQSVVKKSSGWKATGVYAKKIDTFRVDEKLEKILRRLKKIIPIHFYGVDLLRRGDEWLVLEVNQTPAFDFLDKERKKLIFEVVKYLKSEALKGKKLKRGKR